MSQYNENDNMTSKSTWGRMFWNMGHLVSFAYPDHPSEIEKEQTARFFESFSYVLPCEECKNDYGNMLKNYPVRNYTQNKYSLSKWFYDIHCNVNAKLGKKNTVSYEDARKKFTPCEKTNTECPQKCEKKNTYLIIIGAVFLIVLFLILINKKRKN